MMENLRIHSFPPIWAPDSRVLVLGTMPSVASLSKGQYYAHPRNAMWPILGDVLGEALPGSYPLRVEMLLRHKVAMWDAAQSCVRPGSGDSAMRDILPNDISGLLALCRDMRLVCLNGGTAERLYQKHIVTPEGVSVLLMPSTSPAYTLPYGQKLARWMVMREYL